MTPRTAILVGGPKHGECMNVPDAGPLLVHRARPMGALAMWDAPLLPLDNCVETYTRRTWIDLGPTENAQRGVRLNVWIHQSIADGDYAPAIVGALIRVFGAPGPTGVIDLEPEHEWWERTAPLGGPRR